MSPHIRTSGEIFPLMASFKITQLSSSMYAEVARIGNPGGIFFVLYDGLSQKWVALPRFSRTIQHRRHTTHLSIRITVGEYKPYVFGQCFSQIFRKGGAHSAPTAMEGPSENSALECAERSVQDCNGDGNSGPYESGTSDVAPSIGMVTDFRGAGTDVILFGRRAMKYTQQFPHIRKYLVL